MQWIVMFSRRTEAHLEAARRVAREQQPRYRAVRFTDRRKEASRRACRGRWMPNSD